MTARPGTNRHEIGAPASQTGALKRRIVTSEGGGFNPTLNLGGGAGFCGLEPPGFGAGA